MSEALPHVYADVANYVPRDTRFLLLSVTQSGMDIGVDGLLDSMEASFSVTDRPGTFTIETPLVYENVPDPAAQGALIYEHIIAAIKIIEALYAL